MFKDMLLGVSVRATIIKSDVRERCIKGIAALAASSPVFALAAGDDLAGMGTAVADGADSFKKDALRIAQLVGVLFVIGAFIAAKTKKDNPQIKVSHIIGAGAFGVCLIAVPEMIKRSQSQLGLAPVNVG